MLLVFCLAIKILYSAKRRVRAGATVMRYFGNRQVPVKDAGGNKRAATLAVGLDKTRVCGSGDMQESPALNRLHGIQPIPTRIPEAVHYCSAALFGAEPRGCLFFNSFQC